MILRGVLCNWGMRARRVFRLAFALMIIAATAAPVAAAAVQPSAGISQWVEANGVSLRYQLTGSGKNAIVFIHEMTMTLESWDYVLHAFQREHRILRYDMRGWGLSEKINGSLTMDQPVEDLRGLLDALNLKDKVVLVGGAAGADVALSFAAKYPERVKGVATFSAAIDLGPRDRLTDPARVGSPGSDDPYELVYPRALRNDSAKWARFVGINRASDPQSLRSWATMVAAFDFATMLPRISVPTLIVGTSLYPRRSMATMKAIAGAIPNAQFIELETGHFAAFESPELVIPVLVQFLKSVGR